MASWGCGQTQASTLLIYYFWPSYQTGKFPYCNLSFLEEAQGGSAAVATLFKWMHVVVIETSQGSTLISLSLCLVILFLTEHVSSKLAAAVRASIMRLWTFHP